MTSRSDRIAALTTAIAARLERVRGDTTDEEFATLVEDVARTALKFEEFEAKHIGRLTRGIDLFATPAHRPVPRA